ncbi:hypothetical protein HMPREF9005_1977 [Actinomyces sp. oral taxon 178 str. F0338]|nr:hypothetical protein HMPREF9005_1977 [Actinomyces sp. oral taxon 178 str. F0338]
MSAVSISRFTPSTMPEDLLARLFVVRQPVLESLMKRVGDLGATPSPHHTLLVGPRGAGKTHLISLVYHRAKNRAGTDGGKPLRIAWLPEDPWTIVSYARLLAAILERVAPDTGVKSADEAELDARLRSTSRKDGPVLVLMENVDQILDALGEVGQQKLRNLLQTESGVLIIGSTTRLDRSLSSHAAPFFGFFDTIRLEPFSPEEAREMLTALAREAGNAELAERLSSSGALARIHTIAHLAGGQPRLWALLGSALTVEELRDLAALLLSRFDDLTPYYQEQLARLSPLQRLIVAELAAADRPLPVKDIAERVGSDQRSVAKAVGDLAERGWLKPVSTIFTELLDRRRTYYDLAEPLARLAFQIKESRGEPLPLVVDFLVNWFDADQLRSSDGSDYGRVALMRMEQDEVGGLARRLTSLPESRIPSLDLLGQVEDALAAFSAGDAEPVMALRSTLRQAIELRAHDEGGIASVRLELLDDALREVGDVPRGDTNSAWVGRAERLDAEAQSPQSRLILVRWLAASWRFDEAEAALGTISSEQAALEGANAIAYAYVSAGRMADAIALFEEVLADSLRILGHDHIDTLVFRGNLAGTYQVVGRFDEAISLYEEAVADSVRIFGSDDLATLSVRSNLAGALLAVGRVGEAVVMFRELLADRLRVFGADHSVTIVARKSLAGVCLVAGCVDEAVALYEEVVADQLRVLGPDHPDTVASRGSLAGACRSAGRLADAITLYKDVVADQLRVLGPDHPDTLASRGSLAGACWEAGHLDEAITLFEQVLADQLRVLGPNHPYTVASRCYLARAYREAGRVDDATAVLDPPTDSDDVDARRIESR